MIVDENIISVTDTDFEETVLRSNMHVMVDYWAEWCAPCKAIAPVLEEIAVEYKGKLLIAKMDIEANPKTPQKYIVRGVPTLMIFKDGNVAATQVGQLSKSQLSAFIDSVI